MRDDGVILASLHHRAYGHDYKGLDQLGRGEDCQTCEILFPCSFHTESMRYFRRKLWNLSQGLCSFKGENLLVPYSEIEHDGTCRHFGRRGSRIGAGNRIYCVYCIRGLVCGACNRLIAYSEQSVNAGLTIATPFLEAYLKERPALDRETNWWK